MTAQKDNKSTRITIRFSSKEHALLCKMKSATTSRTLADFARNKLLEKTITGITRNQSLDDAVQEIIALRKMILPMAINLNQAVRKLHTLSAVEDGKSWLLKFSLEVKIITNRIEEIKVKMNSIADEWLR